MGFDDDLLEGLDDYEDPFAGDEYQELELEDEVGPSPIFLVAGGLIVATFLVLLVIVILLVSSQDNEGSADAATAAAQTNEAVFVALRASETRIAIVDATLTATTTLFYGQSTEGAIGSATAQVETVEAQLDGSRTAIAGTATQEQAIIRTEIGGTAFAETQTIVALTPTDTPTTTPTIAPTNIVKIQDVAGNPIPGGIPIYIFLDDGDGVFDPIPPTGPTPTAQALPTLQPTRQITATPSRTPTLPSGTSIDDVSGAGYAPGSDSSEIYSRVADNGAEAAVGQADATETPALPTDTPAPADGDIQVATVITLPDGSFLISGLPPGDYFLVIAGEEFGLTIPEGPEVFEVDINGIMTSIFVIPNVLFPSPTPTPMRQADIDATSTAIAQQTQVATLFPTFQTKVGTTPVVTIDDNLAAALTIVAVTEAFQTAQAGSITPVGTPSVLPETGLFSGDDTASPEDFMILGLLGAGFFAGIVIIRRLRATLQV